MKEKATFSSAGEGIAKFKDGWYRVSWNFKPPKGTRKLKKICEYCPFNEKNQIGEKKHERRRQN